MVGWLLFAFLVAAFGVGLFAEWRQPPPEPEGGFKRLAPLVEAESGRPIANRKLDHTSVNSHPLRATIMRVLAPYRNAHILPRPFR